MSRSLDRTPRIGANLWIWESPVTTEAIREHAPRLAAWGFDLVELPLENPGDWEPVEVRSILDTHGLGAGVCVAMGPGRDLTSTDSTTGRATQDYLRACIDTAETVGATVVAGPMYAPTGVTGPIDTSERTALIARVAANLRPLLDHAEASGVRLAIEPLNRFETSLFNTVAQTMALVDAADHPALGLLLDTFHMNIEERNIGAAIRLAGNRLYHLHACGNDRGAPGGDSIDWLAVRDALRAIDYRGAVTIESFTSANRTIATAASMWRSLAPTQDAIATEGLTFLRNLFAEGAPSARDR
jgi:D-psicose/D-tagatose/L-ribulose 3-epimerase